MQQAPVEDKLLLYDNNNKCYATLIYLPRHRSCCTAVNVYEISRTAVKFPRVSLHLVRYSLLQYPLEHQ